eukprot:CAMPEP_0201551324 /NCGR_PEP_ID=MMETSP0173_2-20130828/7523_1 /ASSEMBLY_ACC=CAM_ASM_000268 /TAXON_ID=218659 /ORGANISM="Vexillifera sp., Strain DIVA3 564/2" /LENGTH=134 /DNA_ID=CAMNT_0047961541 /DNA_START=38 /DNA_END=439 /DNA_ORIENTATION=+
MQELKETRNMHLIAAPTEEQELIELKQLEYVCKVELLSARQRKKLMESGVIGHVLSPHRNSTGSTSSDDYFSSQSSSYEHSDSKTSSCFDEININDSLDDTRSIIQNSQDRTSQDNISLDSSSSDNSFEQTTID